MEQSASSPTEDVLVSRTTQLSAQEATPASARATRTVAAPMSVLVNRYTPIAARRLPPEAMEYMKASVQAEPAWFDIDWITDLDLPALDELDPSQQPLMPFKLDDEDEPSERSVNDAAEPREVASTDDSAKLDTTAESLLFNQIPNTMHRSEFRISSSEDESWLGRLDQSTLTDKVSSITVQRCIATQRYFVDFYYHHLLYLSRREDRLNEMKQFCDRHKLSSEIRERVFNKFCQRETNMLRQRRQRIKVSQFQILSQLGRGAFGTVFLAIKSDTNEICAVKRMKKDLLFTKDKTDNVMTERDVLIAADSEWLVKLLYSFQDAQHLYLAMEYVPGGDMRSLLRVYECLSEQQASFYMAEMVQAVSALHAMGYFHRDIKPENWLIDATGHLKLTDFGLSKSGLMTMFIQHWSRRALGLGRPRALTLADLAERHRSRQRELERVRSLPSKDDRGRAFSRVGSPDYMAPELLASEGYDYLVDYWALGCILYEMIAGFTPFAGYSIEEVFANVREYKTTLTRPTQNDEPVSDAAWDIITKLITDREERLGKGPKGFALLKSHIFFRGLPWDNLRSYSDLPFKPKLDHSLDTFYFEAQNSTAGIALDDDTPSVSDELGEKNPDVTSTSTTTTTMRTPKNALPSSIRIRNTAMFKGFTWEHHGSREQLLADLTEEELLSPSVQKSVEMFRSMSLATQQQQQQQQPQQQQEQQQQDDSR